MSVPNGGYNIYKFFYFVASVSYTLKVFFFEIQKYQKESKIFETLLNREAKIIFFNWWEINKDNEIFLCTIFFVKHDTYFKMR